MSRIMDELIQESIFKNNLASAKRMLEYEAPDREILFVFPNLTIEVIKSLKKELKQTKSTC